MTDKIVVVNFNYGNKENKQIVFNPDCIVGNMLDKFLSETNSIHNKDPDKIQFIYKNRIINSDCFINKTISQAKIKTNGIIKVIDMNDVIGGYKC